MQATILNQCKQQVYTKLNAAVLAATRNESWETGLAESSSGVTRKSQSTEGNGRWDNWDWLARERAAKYFRYVSLVFSTVKTLVQSSYET